MSIDIYRHPERAAFAMGAISDFLDRHLPANIDFGIDMPCEDLIDQLIEVTASGTKDAPEVEISLCSECSRRSARLECLMCKDIFCDQCFSVCHMLESRQTHPTKPVRQECCGLCDVRPAVYTVTKGNGEIVCCETCSKESDKNTSGETSGRRRRISRLQCSICRSTDAELVCLDCDDLCCARCNYEAHHRGRMSDHRTGFISSDDRIWISGKPMSDIEVDELLACTRKKQSEHAKVGFLTKDGSRYWFVFSEGANNI
jgi:hypothetical protein